MRKIVASVIGLGLALAFPASAAPLSARLDAVIDQVLVDGSIVGTVVIVAEHGHVVYHRAAGWADREARRPMREDAIFRLASLTKPIVSAAALSLVEAGALKFDDPVTRYIPDFQPRLPDGTAPTITIRQLMSHTAGLSYRFLEPADGPYARANVSDGADQPGLSITENLHRIASVPLAYAPGRGWGYSVATDVLGEVVARAGHATLPDVVAARVTRPLGMTDTAFTVRAADRLTAAYGDASPPVRMGEHHLVALGQGAVSFAPARVLDPASYPSGGAGMVGTAPDFLALLEGLRRGGAPILSTASVTALTTNAVDEPLVDAAGPGWGFGLGVSVLTDAARAHTPQSAGTWQWGGVYGHSWFVDPARELVVIVMTNTALAGMTGGDYPTRIRDAVYGVDASGR